MFKKITPKFLSPGQAYVPASHCDTVKFQILQVPGGNQPQSHMSSVLTTLHPKEVPNLAKARVPEQCPTLKVIFLT